MKPQLVVLWMSIILPVNDDLIPQNNININHSLNKLSNKIHFLRINPH